MKLNILFISALCLSIVNIVRSAVIGIDFGSNYYKISLIAPGKSFVIVESMASQRKVDSAISFVQNKRFYETEAINKRARYPNNSFVFVQQFLGALEENQEVFETSKKYYNEYQDSFDSDRGTVQFTLKNFKFDDDEDDILTLRVEEVAAQVFRYAKSLAEKMGNTSIKDCVVTVPTHWGFAQKIALADSLALADLSPLNFISENTAAGLYYGVDRMDKEKTHTVLFYNIGAYNLQASLIEYNAVNSTKKSQQNTTKAQIESVNVLADYSIPDVGGWAYDKVIADYFAEEIDAKPERQGKPSIKTNRRTMVKLLKECTKTKEVLSANKVAQFNSEGLYDGKDFQSSISRQTFEEKSEELLSVLTKPIEVILERSGKKLSDIDIIELIGGGSRIPKIQQILQEYVGELELGSHMNGDESMALGASFHGANFSSQFRVRDVLLSDGYNFEVKAEISNLDENVKEGSDDYYFKNFTLFPFKKRFGSRKSVNFGQNQNLKVDLYTQDYEGLKSKYATFNLTNIEKIKNNTHFNETIKPKVHLEFEISSIDGIVLSEAQVKFNYTATEKLDKAEIKRIKKDRETKREKAKKKAEKAEKDKKKKKDKKVADGESATQEEVVEVVPEPVEDGEIQTIRYRNKTSTLEINVEESYSGLQNLNKTQFRKSQRLLKRFDLYEERQRNLSMIKNKYESYTYQLREWLDDEWFQKFSKDEELLKLEEQRQLEIEWLDSDEAYSGNQTTYEQHLKSLEDLAYPTLMRLDEAKHRPNYVNKTIEEIQGFEKKVAMLEKDNKWLNETDLEPVKTELNTTIEWFKAKLDEQKPLAQNEDPAFSYRELRPRLEEIHKLYMKVKAIKEPKKIGDKKEKKSTDKKPKKGKKQSVVIDGETVEFDFDEMKKEKEFKNFDFEKFQQNLKKEQEAKKKQEEKEENESKQKANEEEEELDENNNNNEQQQNEEKDDL